MSSTLVTIAAQVISAQLSYFSFFGALIYFPIYH